ncbi:MAG: response regulator transcription factor, partial [Oscillospiraceae bacterium]|nr:response regulator transcription factor [Oscillospiraceae bacterium]
MPRSVLIVEDDKNIADLLRLYLEKEGMTCHVAGDGLEGLEKFHAAQPDLVILDIMLPSMDGWSVCRKIRETSRTPIIMLTAKGELEDKVSGLEMGADDYITKPFETKEVLARVHA